MRKLSFLGLLAVVISFGFTDIYAQGNSRNARNGQTDGQRSGSSVVDVDIVFGSDQLSLIRAWFGNESNLKGLPPGLAKRETLPPGLQRQLHRNGTLPPGLQSKLHPFPVDLERRLPTLRPGIRRVIIGGSIVLLDGSVILDIAAIF